MTLGAVMVNQSYKGTGSTTRDEEVKDDERDKECVRRT
jgi:hypothetical protein